MTQEDRSNDAIKREKLRRYHDRRLFEDTMSRDKAWVAASSGVSSSIVQAYNDNTRGSLAAGLLNHQKIADPTGNDFQEADRGNPVIVHEGRLAKDR